MRSFWFQVVLAAVCGAIIVAAPDRQAHAASLTTEFASNNGEDGIMFDVQVSSHSLTVTGLDLNLASGTYDLQLYDKPGTFVGFDQTPAAWTLIGGLSGVTSNGVDVPTNVSFPEFTLPANSTTALYVTDTSGGAVEYTDGTAVGTIDASNSDLSILEGAGKAYPFGTAFEPRIFNGTIYYNVNSVPEPSSLILCGLGALGLLVAARRRRKA